MTRDEYAKVRSAADTAASIQMLASYMAEVAAADPNEARLMHACEGLGWMARTLSDDLLDIAEADA